MITLKDNKFTNRFHKDEEGSILIFVLVVFTTMVLVGGTAIDLARHETLRSSMQYNLDRAVLAAASLKQTKVPDDVVDDYMSKIVTIEEVSVTTTYDTGLNFRTVSSTATADFDTMFMRIAGIETLPITVISSAEERIPKLEISLVLDVSGSMGGNSKLQNLKTAAKTFITTMLTGVDDDFVAISIIPFNHSVSPSQTMFDSLNVDEQHNYSRCLEFEDADFEDVTIVPTQNYEQAIYTSLYGGWEDIDDESRTCFNDDYFQILPYSDDENALHDKIDSLEADGWTAGHLGMKWGVAMLDPSFGPVTTDLISEGDVDAGFAAIPSAYTDFDTLKVVIMMGDGANTYEFRMGDDYNGDNSDLWEVRYVNEEFEYGYYVYNASYKTYNEANCSKWYWECVYSGGEEKSAYYLHRSSNNRYLDIESNDWLYSSEFTDLENTLEGWISTTQLDWGDAWGHMASQWYDGKTGEGAFNDLVWGTGREAGEADTAMQSTCDAARDAGLVVYTIGFETNSSTSEKLEDCASTPSHYYDAHGIEISSVFAQIATSIQKLKLTQ